MKRFKVMSWLAWALLAAAPAGAQNQMSAGLDPVADKIECPLDQLEWGIGQSFPDPWWAATYVEGTGYGPSTMFWQGKEMLVCGYTYTVGDGWLQPGFHMEGSYPGGPEEGKIYVLRPYVDTPEENYPCPPSVDVKVLSELPEPWLGTTYPWSLTSKYPSPDYNANVCVYEGKRISQVLRPLITEYPDFTSNPPPAIDDLKQAFTVTKAELTAIPAKKTATCPTAVRFEGRIHVNGPGQIRYRIEENGQVGPLRQIAANAAGGYALAWESDVGAPQQPATIGGLTTEATSANIAVGQARILIESPDGVSESNVASYEITCTPAAPGRLAQPSPEPEPEGLRVAIPQAGAQPQPKPQAKPLMPGRLVTTRLQPGSALPDLRIRTATVEPSKPQVVQVEVVNTGSAASAATGVRLWVVPQGTAWHGPVPPLGAGQSAWTTVQADMAVMTAQRVYARVDDPDKVKETDERNNGHVVK